MNKLLLAAPAAAVFALFALAPVAQAHITLPPGGATAGTTYPAAFRVGHACEGATATTAVKVRVPTGFTPVDAPARPGWTIAVSPTEVSWTANSPDTALPAKEKTAFVVRGKLTSQPGTLWFKVLQTCDKGSADWAQVPSSDTDKPASPAALLDVLPAGVAPVDVRDAWARPTVPGQKSTGVFGKFTAGAGSRLVGASSSAAASVEVHEMKMDGDVMRMREMKDGLPLPAGQTVELAPSGYHIMVMGLKQPLPAGAVLPLTLRFVDGDGRTSERKLDVPATAPAAADAAPGAAPAHQHHMH